MKKISLTENLKPLSEYKKKSQRIYSHGNVVSPVAPIKATSNNLRQGHPELVERVYEKLQNLKEEYRAFYKDEQKLETLLESLEVDDDKFIDNLIKIFESYNNAIDSLNDFDKAFKTSYLDTIKEVIHKYEGELYAINVFIESDAKVRFYKSRIKRIFHSNPEKFEFIYRDDKGLILKVYLAFHTIKAIIPDDASQNIDKLDNHGMLIDTKC